MISNRAQLLTVLLPLCLSVSTILTPFTAIAELRAGAAKVEITPDVKGHRVPLGGYAARKGVPATGIHDPVYARALVVTNGENRVALVSIDLCFLPANVTEDVTQRLKQRGVKENEGIYLFLAATHTHSGPDPLAIHAGNHFTAAGWTAYDTWLRAFISDRITDAVVQAEQHLAPAQIGSATAKMSEGLNRNRRGFPIVDREMTVVKVVTREGKPIAELVDYAAHPTLYEDDMRQVSADWPGVMEAEVEKRTGGESVCLFLNGAEGDASPNGVDGLKSETEKVTVYGSQVAAAAAPLLAMCVPRDDLPLALWTHAVALPPRKPNALFLLAAAQLGLDIKSSRGLVDSLMPPETHLRFVKLGDVLLMGFPCEPCGALGLQAKAEAKRQGFAHPAVVALVNEWLGYGLTKEQYRAGKYESVMSFYGDQFGPALLKGLHEGLSRLP